MGEHGGDDRLGPPLPHRTALHPAPPAFVWNLATPGPPLASLANFRSFRSILSLHHFSPSANGRGGQKLSQGALSQGAATLFPFAFYLPVRTTTKPTGVGLA